jgi:hypothetical protein
MKENKESIDSLKKAGCQEEVKNSMQVTFKGLSMFFLTERNNSFLFIISISQG